MNHLRQRNINWKRSFVPLVIVMTLAFLIRAVFIWFYRPQFVGWFNHSCYYYVQVKGVIEHGSLPSPDMPLLFYLYALSSQLPQLHSLPEEWVIDSEGNWKDYQE